VSGVLGSIQLVTEIEAAIVYRISGTQVQQRIAQGFLEYAGTTLAGVHLYRTTSR
jgi:hypothetical protein